MLSEEESMRLLVGILEKRKRGNGHWGEGRKGILLRSLTGLFLIIAKKSLGTMACFRAKAYIFFGKRRQLIGFQFRLGRSPCRVSGQ